MCIIDLGVLWVLKFGLIKVIIKLNISKTYACISGGTQSISIMLPGSSVFTQVIVDENKINQWNMFFIYPLTNSCTPKYNIIANYVKDCQAYTETQHLHKADSQLLLPKEPSSRPHFWSPDIPTLSKHTQLITYADITITTTHNNIYIYIKSSHTIIPIPHPPFHTCSCTLFTSDPVECITRLNLQINNTTLNIHTHTGSHPRHTTAMQPDHSNHTYCLTQPLCSQIIRNKTIRWHLTNTLHTSKKHKTLHLHTSMPQFVLFRGR